MLPQAVVCLYVRCFQIMICYYCLDGSYLATPMSSNLSQDALPIMMQSL